MSDMDPRTKKELDGVFGPDDDETPRRGPKLVDDSAHDEMPDPAALSHAQYVEAVYRLHEDATAYPQFPWKSLADIAGPLCPEDLVIVAARTGGGKSLFLQNLFDSLVCAGRSCLYIGLEQPPKILRAKWACLRADVAPKFVLAPRPDEYRTAAWYAAVELVQEQLKWQQREPIRSRAHFAGVRKINAAGLRVWTDWGVEHGCQIVIVDHIDRVQHGSGRNPFHEVSETIRLAKELAAEYRITMVLASQVGRPADQLEQFMPPSLHTLRGAGTKEEESDTVFGIYRPLRNGVTDAELKRVRQGLLEKERVFAPGEMAIVLLKHRLDGPVAGKIVKLNVRHQRVFEMAPRAPDLYTP